MEDSPLTTPSSPHPLPSRLEVLEVVCSVLAPQSLRCFTRHPTEVPATVHGCPVTVQALPRSEWLQRLPRPVGKALASAAFPLPLEEPLDLAISLEAQSFGDEALSEAFVACLSAAADRLVLFSRTLGSTSEDFTADPMAWTVGAMAQQGFGLELSLTLQLRAAMSRDDGVGEDIEGLGVWRRLPLPRDTVRLALTLGLTPTYGMELEALAALFGAAAQVPHGQAIVELGSFEGRSTLVLAFGRRARGGPPVVAVDPHHGDPELADRLELPLETIKSFRALKAHLHLSGVEEEVEVWPVDGLVAAQAYQGLSVGLLLLDLTRCREDLQVELSAWFPHLAPHAQVVFAGMTEGPGPRAVLQEALEDGRFTGCVSLNTLCLAQVSPAASMGGRPPPRAVARPRRHLVSLLMPVRNEGTHVRQTVDSLLRCDDGTPFELLVLDDASSDGCTDFLLEAPYCLDRRLNRLREETQMGYQKAWVKGVSRSKGTLLKFLDGHHVFTPHWLSSLLEASERHGYEAIVGPLVCSVNEVDWSLEPSACLAGYTFDPDLTAIKLLEPADVMADGQVPWLCGHQLFMSRLVYERVGGFFPLFQGHGTEDSDLCLRAYRLGISCYAEPTSVIGHLYRATHQNAVTFRDVALNTLMSALMNLGSDYAQRLLLSHREEVGYVKAWRLLPKYAEELERYSERVVRGSRRSARSLLACLALEAYVPKRKRRMRSGDE